MPAAIVDPRDEYRPLCARRRIVDALAPGILGRRGQRILMTLRRAVIEIGLGDVDQAATTGRTRRFPLDEPLGGRDLIRGKLSVLLRIVFGGRAFPGLDVDDNRTALGVTFQAVDTADQAHLRLTSAGKNSIDTDLATDLGELTTR